MSFSMSSNIADVIKILTSKLNMSADEIDEMTRLQATSLMSAMRDRIHVVGLASDGSQIGNYSAPYLKYARPKHHRDSDPKVVLSLTRNMENSMVLYPINRGTGIGYATKENYQKARWCEQTYGKKVFSPTMDEREMTINIGKNYIKRHLHG